MVKRNFFRRLIGLICLFALLIMPLAAFAEENGTRTGSIHIHFHYENGGAIPNALFRVYLVADSREGVGYALTEEFSKYPVTWDELLADEDGTLASTLAAYVSRDQLSAVAEAVTDAQGEAEVADLPEGVYLVIGDSLREDDVMIFPQPAIVSIPTWTEDGTILYDVQIEPKYESRRLDGEKIQRSVLKIWDDGGSKKRPAEITVQLLRDGQVYDEQVLNASNNWRYTWNGLDAAYNWQLMERDVPEGYQVTVEQKSITFTVTNSYDEPTPPPPTTSREPHLPQTGMLWWPVPILVGVGVVLCVAGALIFKGKDRHA